ncbi:MAG: restriction endonuclease subunit S [Firmicutes bacterium HGW-Firmicutes-15]|nr:MAG: restriction endonuclease subunit S [Firmicutes bacterium HGW-Firmicutes-15]
MQIDSACSVTKGIYQTYPSDWTIIELGNLLKKVRKPVEVIPDYNYQQIGIRSHGKGLFYKEPVKGSDLGNKSVFWIEEDCLIINIVFAWEQAVAITTSQEKGMIASHRFPMWQPEGKVDLNYLHKFFLTPLGRHLLDLASPGGAGRNKTLGQDDFNKTLVCIPQKIEEQKKIVEILSTWDNAIQIKEQLIGEKNHQKKWLMQNLLTGKKRLPGFSGKWAEYEYEDTLSTVSVKKYQINSSKYLKRGKYPVVDQGKQLIVAFSNDENKVFSCPYDGIIIFGDHTRELKYIDFDFVLGADGTQVLTAINNNCTRFVYYQLGIKEIPNTGYNRHFKFIKEMSFLLPPLREQIAIAKILATADQEINLHEAQLDELKNQKKALMQLLLTGIIRVNIQEVS